MSEFSSHRPLPGVSVIIPTHNRAAAVCEAVDSVLAQTYQDFEILIVDDGSTDGTGPEVERRFGSDPRVRYLPKANGGPGPARNHGIRHARGELIAFLDSDDLWVREKLELQVNELDRNPQAALCFSDRVLGGERELETSRFLATGFKGDTSLRGIIERNFPICTPSVVVRRTALDEIGAFDESLTCGEDWDLWIRMTARYPITYVDRPLVIVRVLHDSISRTRVLEKWQCWLRLWKKHEELLLRSGCPPGLIRGKQAHAHKKIAQLHHSLASYSRARRHYLQWWRCQPWQVRGLLWWASLSVVDGFVGHRPSEG